jgi:3-oxoacyl-[acyl-carrier-protein] synthase-3
VAIQSAGVVPRDIDLIICGTATPDTIFPATACYVQQKIGADRAAAFDVTAACSGFLYGAIIAEQFILSGLYKTVLVIGAEKLSSIVNWRDRNTCVLFGDGAGAAILQRRGDGGILARDMGTDGGQTDILSLPAGGCRMPATAKVVEEKLNCLQMAGKEVYKYAVQAMEQSAETCLKRAGLKAQDVRWFIPHQANMRIMEAVAGRLEIPMERCIVNVHKYGNTSAACIPIALHEAVREGKIKRGDTILMVAFGGGLTWASMALEW